MPQVFCVASPFMSLAHYLDTVSMKSALYGIGLVLLSGCAVNHNQSGNVTSNGEESPPPAVCTGQVVAPPAYVPKLTEVDDPALVSESVKGPDQGYLCQAKAYKVNESFEIFRSWNSTNPGSELGNWWAFTMPSGSVSEYRENYAICPSWSPLDRMTRCRVKVGSHLVLGTGQSAFCSKYLTYPTSSEIQIFLANASDVLTDCKSYYDVFSWQEKK